MLQPLAGLFSVYSPLRPTPRVHRLGPIFGLGLMWVLAAGCSELDAGAMTFGEDGRPGTTGDEGGGAGEDDDAGDDAGAPEPDECDPSLGSALDLEAIAPRTMADPTRLLALVFGPDQGADLVADLASLRLDPQAFLNHYRVGPQFDGDAPGGAPVHARLQLWHAPLDPPERWILHAAVSAPPRAGARPPIALTLVTDLRSVGASRARLEDAGRAIAAALAPGDVVTLLAPGADVPAPLVEHAVTGPDDPTLKAALAALPELPALPPNTLDAGLLDAYGLTDAPASPEIRGHGQPGPAQRHVWVLAAHDLDAPASLAPTVAEGRDAGARLGVVAVGPAHLPLQGLEALSQLGDGASVFVDGAETAKLRLTDRFDELFGAAVEGLTLSLELPPGFALEAGEAGLGAPRDDRPPLRSGGPDSATGALGLEDPGLGVTLGFGDTLVVLRAVVTCAPELVDDETRFFLHAQWRPSGAPGDDPQPEGLEVETPLLQGSGSSAPDQLLLHKARAIVAVASGLTRWRDAEPSARPATLQAARAELAAVRVAMPYDDDLTELAELLDAVAAR